VKCMVMGEYLTLLTSTGATCRFRQRKRARQVLVAPWKHEEWVLRQHIGDEVDHSYWHTRWCTWTLPWSLLRCWVWCGHSWPWSA
jgi:hypothetical protein